ncbi:MAG TPA: metallophosphoesterase family protein, partial [Anaeromyxobacteraceae bacterium]|nr:metallophosphoesterase family protein [Anaeromyxobacteraceae bacterium]
GLVSDSHGLSDPKLPELFAGCALILHAGDVVKPAVLRDLERLAPVRAVRGNNDLDPAFGPLPETALVPLGRFGALLVHDLGPPAKPHPPLRKLLARERPAVVVHGHSHRPGATVVEGVLFLNPGSAGPRRFSLPRTAALLHVADDRLAFALFDLAGATLAPLCDPVEFRP